MNIDDLIYNICDILDNIPIEVPVEEYIKWLKYEVLTILNPDERSYIYIWIEQRARLVENYEKCPHNALKLMKLIDNNKNAYNSYESLFSSKYKTFSAPTPMHHVDNIILLAHSNSYSIFQNKNTIESMEENKLKHQLQDLVYLWDVHNYKISLEKYDQSEPEGIAFDMLDKVVASELLDKTIKEHFIPYVKENKMNVDKLLSDYCFELMDQTIATSFDISMEERILTILKNISDNEFKVDSLLEFMRRISFIRGQYRLMLFKSMLLDYEIKSYNISKMSLSKGLIKYILSFTSRPNAIDDAIQVINTYHHLNPFDVYIIRIINLCKAEKLNEALYLIKYGRENEESKRNKENKNHNKFNIQSFIDRHLVDQPEKVEELENILYEIYYGEEDHYSVEDSIIISNHITRWLIENLEEIISSVTTRGYIILNKDNKLHDSDIKAMTNQEELDEAISKYRWIIKSLVQINNLLSELIEENESKIKDSYISRSTMPYTSGARFTEDSKAKMKNFKLYIKNINILFEEFGVMVSYKSYKSKDFRKKLLIKYTRLNISSHGLSIDVTNHKGKGGEEEKSVKEVGHRIKDYTYNHQDKNAMVIDEVGGPSSSQISPTTTTTNTKNKKKQSTVNENRKIVDSMEISDIFNDNHSNLYRFSEILCISRNEFKGIMAVEASHYGDYEVAILQGKELFKKNKNKETATVLKSLIDTIITNVLNKSIDFNNIRKNNRFTNQIQYMSQKALSICDESEIDEYLNVFKNCELMNFIFSQCDSGNYTILIRNNKGIFEVTKYN
ncbi:hypothetical protein PIROE2DRAFT_7929 [Piromyces sp. E2]|nr:hypothetical protein PIROE2DRAFT_7929 [Piromyces sp. E2]|eukprot:OUM65123.1 hypothetical protein PIROE2DRAFT_7929 [Piromyces sp. E2]